MDDQVWRDESTGLPIHVHLTGDGFNVLFESVRKPCSCGNPFFDISKSAADLIKKHDRINDENRSLWEDKPASPDGLQLPLPRDFDV